MDRRQRLVIICGLPGVGKTTVAHALARRINAVVITSEKVVGELFRNSKRVRQDKDWTCRELVQGYNELFSREERALKAGHTVIVEGSFRFDRQRRSAIARAEKLGIPHMVIFVTCPANVLKKRLEERFKSTQHQFGYQAHLAVKKVYEKVKHPTMTIDSSKSLRTQIDGILEYLKGIKGATVDANRWIVRKLG